MPLNRGEIRTEVMVRGAIDTTSSFITETMLNDWINQGYLWAAAYKKWPCTEYMDKSQTYSSATEEWSYPINFKSDSIRTLKIGDDILKKIGFQDYLQYRENYPSGTRLFFSDYGRRYYVNPNCGCSGTIYAYGQYTPGVITSDSGSTVFSTWEPEGDEAIIHRALELVKIKQKKLQEALTFNQRARQDLEELWQKVLGEQAMYQTYDRPMFKRFNILDGSWWDDENNPLRW